MTITTLPPAPNRGDPSNFAAKGDALLSALPTFVSEANALAANLNSIAAGGAYAIPYILGVDYGGDPKSVGTTAGILAFDTSKASQSLTTLLYANLTDAGGQSAAVLDQFDDSSSAIRGLVRIFKQGDTTKWMRLNITGANSNGTAHRALQVAVVDSSSASPFAIGDPVILQFTRNGDVGPPGTLTRRTATTPTNSAPSPNIVNTDMYIITALAGPTTLSAPTGTPSDGQSLMFRIKDNGTARTISYTTNYRASVELPFPSTTVVGKTLYMGFVYNAADAKWDLVAVLGNV